MTKTIQCRNPRETNWVAYSISLKRISAKVVRVENLEDTIITAYQLSREKQKRDEVYWNGKLGKLRKTVRRLFNKAKADNDWDQYKSKVTEYNKEIQNAKRDSSRTFCE